MSRLIHFVLFIKNTKIDDNVVIYGNSIIGPNVEIGKNTIILS